MNTNAQHARLRAFSRLETLTDADARRLGKLSLQLSPEARLDVRSLRRDIRRGTSSVFVLRNRSRIVASVTAARYSTPTGAHCHIEDVVVDSRHRGKGFGRKIMQADLAALREMGVSHVELTSRPSRVAAQALYRSLGFTPRETGVFELRMGETFSDRRRFGQTRVTPADRNTTPSQPAGA